MPWIIGIDEAGYGPNLGPLVMTSVACRVPEDLTGADLWQVLKAAVRRKRSRDNGRILIEDSKLVYSPTRGLHALESGVLATVSPWRGSEDLSLERFLDWLSPAAAAELSREPWYTGSSLLPVEAEPAAWTAAAAGFEDVCGRCGVVKGLVRSVVICPPQFNALLDQWDSKGAILAHGLIQLVECNHQAAGSEPVAFFVDKHGGRNNYAAVLQHALPDGLVVAQEEGMARSFYRVLGLGRETCLTFQPRADGEHFCVALASMVSKYLREVLMREFNCFWQTHVPGLKPTAGYPGDALRFLEAIRPALARLGLAEQAIWRRK